VRFAIAALLFATSLNAADLSVAWIARNPKIDYVWDSANPTVEGWPAEGSAVTWVAHVRSLGTEPLQGVAYRWRIDGVVVKTGTLDFAPQSIVQTELPWTWTFARHQIAFEIDPANRIQESNERNNRVDVATNALGIGLYVERGFWDGIGPQLQEAAIGVTTFDDWLQKLVRRFNEMAQYATYPDSPNGVLDRWRIDEIHIVDDNALPLVPPYTEARDWGAPPASFGTLYPNVADHTVDMQWGYPTSAVTFWPEHTPWIFMIGNSTVHEFAHARTMIDAYAWNISTDNDQIDISGGPQPLPPSTGIFSTHDHGMMHFDWGHVDPYTAAAMNLMTGRRAIKGNYNEPWDLGWFLNDIPNTNRVKLIRADNTPIANRSVNLYRAQPKPGTSNYNMLFDKTADLTLQSDGAGVIVLSRNAFAEPIISHIDAQNGTSILRISDGGTTRWAFLESLEFNMAYWRGNTDLADYTVMADAPVCFDSLGPSSILPLPEALVTTPDVAFQFAATGGHHYELQYAVNGGAPMSAELPLPVKSQVKATLAVPPGRVVWWFIDHDPPAGCPEKHSSVYAFDHDLGGPHRRAATP